MKPLVRFATGAVIGVAAQFLCAGAASAKTIPGEKNCATLAVQTTEKTVTARFQTGDDKGSSAPFCRISGELRPVAGSKIGFELWIPIHWNGRILMLGNGGYSSALPTAQMQVYVQRGYAVMATDTGHQGDDPNFARGHPQAIDDWGWRAVHETAVASKALVRRFHGRRARYSYFNGCSTGGQQALMEAQRFPTDFNGIVTGAPGSNRTRLNVGFLWQYLSNHRPDGSLVVPASKLKLLTEAALRSCGGDKAVAAGYLADPFSCRFDPATVSCDGAVSEACLSQEELAAARRMYAGARDPRTGAQIYPPWLPGSESIGPKGTPLPGWSLYWADPAKPSQPMRVNFFRDWVFKDPMWNWNGFDFSDLSALSALARQIDASSPDLGGFRKSGGKLIQYHGLADPVVSPWDSRHYYASVIDRLGGATRDFYRLFFMPGMGHCGGGPGLSPVDPQSAIEAWVERKQRPMSLRAASPEKMIFEVPAE